MRSGMSRRTVLKTAALASTTMITAPYVRGAYAAGSLALGCWDHWVPGANKALIKLCNEWGEKNKVDVKIDFITSQGEKDKLTAAAEAQAGTGHDIMSHRDWNIRIHQAVLEPLDDVVDGLIKKYGPISPVAEYLAKIKGTWRGVPTAIGSQVKPCCSRFDLYKEHAGLDIREMFPSDEKKWDKAKVDAWTWDAYVTSAQKLHKAGFPVGLPMGQTSDAVDWVGGLFNAYGVVFVDAKDQIKINSDQTRQAMEIARKIMEASPPEVYAWDDAGNNRWLISGKGSGGRQARQSEGGGAVLDASGAKRAEGPLRRTTAAVLRAVEVLQEQIGCERTAHLHLAEGIGRATGRGVGRLRPAVVQDHVRPSHLEHGRTAGRHRVQLSAAR